MEERQAKSRNFARKFLGFMSSKRKRDEEKKRMDLWKAMRDSSVERLAAVIASARTEFGDQLHDLCSDAEGVLQRLLRESRASGTRRKITLRERLLLADIEGSQQQAQPAQVPEETPTATPRENCSGNTEIVPAAEGPPVIQAVLTLVRPSAGDEIQQQQTSSDDGRRSSLAAQPVPGEPNATSGRRLLSALLWEERNLDGPDQGLSEGWVAFGVSVETAPIHFDHSRSHSVASELNRVSFHHRPSASLDAPPPPEAAPPARTLSSFITTSASSPRTGAVTSSETVPQTPMRVSLMSLLRDAEEGGSGIIFMNRQVLDRSSSHRVALESPSKDGDGGTGDGVATEQMCCVCMGRPKGAAFIPCGHTFCRRCCRELQYARGSCPLCNKEISDVLNLY